MVRPMIPKHYYDDYLLYLDHLFRRQHTTPWRWQTKLLAKELPDELLATVQLFLALPGLLPLDLVVGKVVLQKQTRDSFNSTVVTVLA